MTNKKRFNIDREKLNKLQNDMRKNLGPDANALNGGMCVEPVPNHVTLESEEVIRGQNNSWIVLGRDRPSHRSSGYNSNTGAGAIDIVVGKSANRADSNKYVDPNFRFDAARIYISQKTDIDDNFGIVDGKIGNVKTRSGIGLKADAVRLISRDGGIKLVTRTDSKNSQGGDAPGAYGIDLLATNDKSKLEPVVKGLALSRALEEMAVQISKLNGITDDLLMRQSALNEAITHHTHLGLIPKYFIGPYPVFETLPSFPVTAKGIKTAIDHLSCTKTSLVSNKFNMGSFVSKYLLEGSEDYILSRFVNTT
jgi:hypothetical protein